MDAPNTGTSRLSTAEMLSRLVSYDTTSRNSNLRLIGFVREYLDAHGIPYRVSTDATGEKANVHAIIGPQQPGGVALSGHVDTVPVDGQAWSADPFTLRRAGGRLHARGAVDMKGFVSACLAAVPDFKARKLARPLHLFISYDEEVGCLGARRLIEDLDASGLKPALCIVGEPSGMRPILAHKGKLNLRVRVRGRTGHSSEPAKGVNAVQAAGEAIGYVVAEARRLAREGPFEDGFDPPHTTIHVGTIQGGTILNIIPERCEFTMEWRTIPGDDATRHVERMRAFVAAAIEPAMHAVHRGHRLRLRGDRQHAWHVARSRSPADRTRQAAHRLQQHRQGKLRHRGRLLSECRYPDDHLWSRHVAQAHQPDEWIAQDQLDLCDVFIRRLADHLLT